MLSPDSVDGGESSIIENSGVTYAQPLSGELTNEEDNLYN